MAYKVLIPQDITDPGKSYLRERGYEVVIGTGTDEQTIQREVSGCDAILVRTASITRAVMEAAPALKVIGRHGIGVDNIDMEAAHQRGVTVTFAPTSNANSVAEHTMMLLLECARNACAVAEEFRGKGDFEVRNRLKGVDLEGKTLGLIGLGRIGRLVARKAAHGFAMSVIGYDPFVKEEDAPAEMAVAASVEEVLEKADFVSLHMPATKDTKGSFGIKQFSMMKPSAFFINAARGEIVREDELIQALNEGVIRGAALDVFVKEPPDVDNPLLSMPNVIATPHNAALTREAMDRMGLHAAIGIDEVLSGKAPTWPAG